MFKKIKNYITYKKKVKAIKVYGTNLLLNIIANRVDYINGLANLLTVANKTTDKDELASLLSGITSFIAPDKKD